MKSRSSIIGASLIGASVFGAGVTYFPIFPESVKEITRRAEPAVVLITTFTPEGQEGIGAGFVTDRGGYIVTDYHVASAEKCKIFVTRQDGKSWPADVIGGDQVTDITVLKIDPKATERLPVLKWGDSNTLEQGDPVALIGHPFSATFSLTFGIVSAVHRDYGPSGAHADFVQVDAPVNPGNSGGPVFNTQGKVVGVVKSIAAPLGNGSPQSAGVAFAVSSEIARKAVADIMTYGSVKNGLPRFAVEPTSPEPKIGELAPPRYSEGARVVFFDADGTPQLSGLKMGDVITRFDNRPVNNPNDFAIAAFLTHPAEVHSLTVRRNGRKEISISIVMGGDALPLHPVPPEPQPLAPRQINGMTVAAPAL